MASQIIPLTGLDKAGVVIDQPSVSLPPNIFTDVRNMRFRHGAVRKMEGDQILFSDTDIQYVAFWPNPNLTNDGYWVVVSGSELWLRQASNGAQHRVYTGLSTLGTVWQHTLFHGGFGFIINNGVDRPLYLLDADGNSNIASIADAAVLPGWDSYIVNERVIDAEYTSGSSYFFDLGQKIDWEQTRIEVTRTRGTNDPVTFADTDVAGDSGTPGDTDYVPANLPSGDIPRPGNQEYTIYNDTETNTTVLHIGAGLAGGDILQINIQSRREVNVRAGVIRSFGDLLVAGDLTEYVGNTTIRRLAGVVRTSDVAQAGSIPNNWNPFFEGASTADEFTLSGTGRIQDMVELQGNMIVYTNDSIHQLSLTGQSAAPVSFRPITRQYGALTLNAVQEYDGKHLVLGSEDIYLFGGHPANIQSVAEGRIRDYFYENLDTDVATRNSLQIVRNQGKDELWIVYKKRNTADTYEVLVFNYRMNTWTIRDITTGVIVNDAPLGGTDFNVVKPIVADDSDVYQADYPGTIIGTGYVERRVAPITPEFNTESAMGLALWTQGNGNLTVTYAGSNTPSNETESLSSRADFNIAEDYKTDIRMNGRFMNFRIEDSGATDDWNLSGIQLEVTVGGKR